MNPSLASETLKQLQQYTLAACKLLGVSLTVRSRNHSGPYGEEQPTGIICHYTASNAAYGPKRPYGRLPALLNRLRPFSGQGVGCHVVVWDEQLPRLTELKSRFPLIKDVPAQVFYFGDENALWHAGSANRWSLGIEVRNCGEILKVKTGYYWCRGRHRYRGRPPLIMNSRLWEPYTRSQMVGTLWVSRLFAQVHPIEVHRFLGHTHISSTRVDPGPHFPIHEMRSAVFDTPDTPLLEVPFLKEFLDPKEGERAHDDPHVSESSLHLGLYRHDWDGEFNSSDLPTDKKVLVDQVETPADPDLIPKVKKALRRLGYYPGKVDDTLMTDEFVDTVALFQSRWKKRIMHRGRRRWVQAIPVNGKVDQDLVDLITKFERQQIHLVS